MEKYDQVTIIDIIIIAILTISLSLFFYYVENNRHI